ncbi:MAG: FAD-dependent oxidoreductase [Candidatus Eremiobacteraeota bacterium]|nr:FAD-dependent oxidoreductase [Candidatus Eremiobacteraeota bacterium]
MSKIIDKKTVKELKEIFDPLPHSVDIVFFTQEPECPMCLQQHQVLDEIAEISKNVNLKVYNFVKDHKKAQEYRIDKIPATAIIAGKDHGIRFYGITAGYEFTTLVETIMMVSVGKSGLHPDLIKLIRSIRDPVHLQVLVTLTCPYCPKAVHTAHRFALENENIRADMVEVSGFPTVAQKYDVQGVPRIVINETSFIEGAVPAEMMSVEILKAVNPDEFSSLRESIREEEPGRKVRKADPGHTYETIIVGGGPAALCAAVYAARKALDVLLVSKMIGGQIYYTASVENYLGFPGIDGREMIERFKKHAEEYPIAMYLGEFVERIRKDGKNFLVNMEKGKTFRGKSIIYCAGKEYKRLGVPGEDQFIGRGIAFCATCDAPLFKDKTVAVVGGGNSALTAARDLMPYANKVYIIHRRDELTGDPTLFKQLKMIDKVKVYTPWNIVSFTGTDRLRGLRMVKSDFSDMMDIMVDGVFLEIGLTPNTKPVKELIDLNQQGEIPVGRDNAASLKGFFAAGDVTDIPEKQICVATGEGGKAAIAVNRYLRGMDSAGNELEIRDSW